MLINLIPDRLDVAWVPALGVRFHLGCKVAAYEGGKLKLDGPGLTVT